VSFLKLALYIYSTENAKNEHLRKIYFVTLMGGIAQLSRGRAFRVLRVDHLPRRPAGARLHVAGEMASCGDQDQMGTPCSGRLLSLSKRPQMSNVSYTNMFA
jgi:hypothetical protein